MADYQKELYSKIEEYLKDLHTDAQKLEYRTSGTGEDALGDNEQQVFIGDIYSQLPAGRTAGFIIDISLPVPPEGQTWNSGTVKVVSSVSITYGSPDLEDVRKKVQRLLYGTNYAGSAVKGTLYAQVFRPFLIESVVDVEIGEVAEQQGLFSGEVILDIDIPRYYTSDTER